jgi:hypothetical protein
MSTTTPSTAKRGRPKKYRTAGELRDRDMAVRGYMPATEAARMARMDATHLWRLVTEGTLRGEHVGQRWRYVQRRALAAYVGTLARELGLLKPLRGERHDRATPAT